MVPLQTYRHLLQGLEKAGLKKKDFKLPHRPYPGLEPRPEGQRSPAAHRAADSPAPLGQRKRRRQRCGSGVKDAGTVWLQKLPAGSEVLPQGREGAEGKLALHALLHKGRIRPEPPGHRLQGVVMLEDTEHSVGLRIVVEIAETSFPVGNPLLFKLAAGALSIGAV